MLRLTSRSLCSICDLLVFSTFKAGHSWSRYDPNAKISSKYQDFQEKIEKTSGQREGGRDCEIFLFIRFIRLFPFYKFIRFIRFFTKGTVKFNSL